MSKIFHYLVLLVGVIIPFQAANSSSPISWIDDLPTDVTPIEYLLDTTIDWNNDEIVFHGRVMITIKCEANTKEIVLHVKDLKIVKSQVGLTDINSHPVEIESQDYKPTKDRYIITLVDKLITNRMYKLYVPFKKKDSVNFSDRGYSQYDYSAVPDEPKKIIALTKADINDARRFLPCMDQMNLKATFRVRLTIIPENLIAITNMTLEDTSHDYSDENNRTPPTYHFKNSIPMSTYSLALAVVQLSSTEHKIPTTGTTITIFSTKAIKDEMDFITNVILRSFEFYSDFFKVSSTQVTLEDLNVLILPNFREMKTEKFGLIMLDESAVHHADPRDYDNSINTALHVCYVMSRQWIGAQATMLNWSEYWVQVALAKLLRVSCLGKLIPGNHSNILDCELVESYLHVLRRDGESMSRPVHVPKDDFDLSTAFSDSVLTEKAHLLIRMMSFFLYKFKFLEGVKKYYYDFKLRNSSLDEIWQVFEKVRIKNVNAWPENITLKAVMDTWIKKKGYPVVTVTRNYETKLVHLSQEPFVQLGDEAEERTVASLEDNIWIIPLRYITQTKLMSYKNFQYPMNLWLTTAEATIPHQEDELLLLDLELNVLCRVHYELDDWKRIHDILRDENLYSSIKEMSRVNLVSDMFALAEAGKLPYQILFSTMKYLPHEISDYPLMLALNEFNKIRSTLFGSKALEPYEKYMKQILTPIFEKDRWVNIRELTKYNRQEIKLKKLIIETSCKVGVEKCIKQCQNLFKEWIDNDKVGKDNPIPKDIREIVSCQAIKHGGEKKWYFLQHQYEQSQDQTFRETILTAFGCTQHVYTMQLILDWITDKPYKHPAKNSLTIFKGLASNENGYREMKRFIESTLDRLIEQFDGYTGIIGSFLAKLFEVTNTRQDFTELKKLTVSVKDHVRDSGEVLNQSMKMAERNWLWRSMYEEVFKRLFRNPIDLGTASGPAEETQ